MRVFLLGFLSGAVCACGVLRWAGRDDVARLPDARRAVASPVPGASAEPPEIVASPAALISDYERLGQRELALPVAGAEAVLVDNFGEVRGDHPHEALDIVAPRGTAVVAVDDGVVRKLFTSVRGGLTVYQFDPSESYCYYYAHLDRYSEGLAEGTALRKRDVVGYVGTTGNAPRETPHLHFTIFKLGPEKRWWEGVPVNPYSLWAQAGSR